MRRAYPIQGWFREYLWCSTFYLPGATGARSYCYSGCRVAWRKPQSMVRGCTGGGQTAEAGRVARRTGDDTLLLRDLWFANVGKESGVGGAALRKVHPRLAEAQLSIYGVANVGCIGIFLTIVFPPADRTQGKRCRSVKCPVPAARASKSNQCRPHVEMDGI